MANEFKVKKGLVVNGSGSVILDVQGSQGQLFSVTDQLSGSLFSVNDISGMPILAVSSDDSVRLGTFNREAIKVSGSNATITGSFTGSLSGSLFGTASWASNATTASYVLQAVSASFATNAVSASFATNAANATTASYVLNAVSASQAATASSADNFLVRGTLTAQTIVAQTITSSTDFVTGSTRFGSLLANTHQFTGSVSVTGSLSVNNNSVVLGTGSAGQVAYWNGTSLQTGSANFVWNNATNVLTVGGTTTSDSGVGFRFVGSSNNARLGVYDTSKIGVYLGCTNSIPSIYGYDYTSGSVIKLILQEFGGNVSIGSTADNGSRLQVYGDAFIKGSGATSATSALTIQDSAGANIITFRNDKTIQVPVNNEFTFGSPGSGTIGALLKSQTGIGLNIQGGTGTNISNDTFVNVFTNQSNTSGTHNFFNIGGNTNPTSGTGIFNLLSLSTAINQTGGANGITRGLYVNPTLTAAADWRSIEWSNNAATAPSASWGLYGAGTAPNYLAGNLSIGTLTTGSALTVSGSSVMSGSFTVVTGSGIEFQVTNTGVKVGNAITDTHTVTGSLNISGSVTATNFTGSLFGTASWAQNAVTSSYILNAVSASFASTSVSASFATNAATATTASYVLQAVSASFATNATSASFASTASSADNFLVRGTLTAQTIVAQTITSSTDFVTGSTRFGSLISNTHQFTGSVSMTGSLAVTGPINSYSGSLTLFSSQSAQAASIDIKNFNGTSVIQLNNNGSSVFNDGMSVPYIYTAASSLITPSNWMFGPNFVIGASAKVHISGSANAALFRIDSPLLNNIIFVSGSGNVGIGTNSPTKRLEVYDSASGDGLSIVRSSVTTQRIEIIPNDGTASTLIKGGGNNKPLYIASWANGGTAQPLHFGTNYATGLNEVRMTIDTTGSVGIGTLSPLYKLDVSGSSRFTSDMIITGSSNTSGSTALIVANSNTSSLLAVRNDGMVIVGSGSYSWGTSLTTGGKLTIANTSGYNGLVISNGTSDSSYALSINTTTSDAIGVRFFWSDGNASPFLQHANNLGTIVGGTLPVTLKGSTATVSSSLTVITGGGIELQVTNTGVKIGNAITDVHTVTGSLGISGSVTATNFTGSLFGTASWAQNAVTSSYILNAVSASFATNAVSASFATNAANATTASYVLQAVSASFATNAATATTASYVLNAVSASFASTASSADNFLVRGTLTAQTIVAQVITSSTDFVTGSTRFGSSLANTHQFTGSVSMTGSLLVNNSLTLTGSLLISGSSPLIQLGSTTFVGDITNPAITFGSTSNGIYTDSSRVFFKAGGSFAGGFSSAGLQGNQIQIRNDAFNDLTTAMYIPYRLNAIGLTSGLGGNDTGAVTLITSGSVRLYISSSGNIGIGTTAPDRKLSVSGSIGAYVGNNEGAVSITVGEGSTGTTGNIISLETNSTNNTTRIYNSGTSTPLYIGSTGTSSGVALSAVSNISLNINNGGDVFAGTTALFVSASGNVGIGTTSPTEKLHVVGDVRFTANTYVGGIINAYQGDASIWVPNVGQAFTIKQNTGNVGIGTTSPSAKLDVNGNAVISGSFTVITGSNIEFQVLQTGVKLGNAGTDTITLTGSLNVSSSNVAANLRGSGSGVFSIDGTSGRLFQVDDSLTGSLFSVNTAAGLPVIEAFSDNTVRIGQYGRRALFVSQSAVGIGKETLLNGVLDISGSANITGSLNVSGSITGSLFGTASWANNATTSSYVLNAVSASFATNAVSASYVLQAVSASFATNAANSTSASFASTASSADNFLVRGTLTAQTIVAQVITSSTDFVTGSTRFGTLLTNTHQFTGSVSITGSLIVNNIISATSEYRLNNLSYARVATLDSSGGFGGGYNFNWNNGTPIHDSIGSMSAYGYANDGTIRFYASASAPAGTAAQERLRITAAGNVGIGTTTPGYRLQVDGANTAGFVTAIVAKNPNTDANSASKIGFDTGGTIFGEIGVSYNSNNPYLAFFVRAASEKMRITDAGNVGIGTTSPISKLHVVGGYYGTSEIIFGSSTGRLTNSGNDVFLDAVNAGSLILRTNSTEALRINSSRDVGIGTNSPTARLHVSGTTGGVFEVDVASAVTALYVSASGNVGIGTTTPTLATLQVNGNVFATSFTGSFSGSFAGTITNATSASFASTASFVANAFIQGGNSFGAQALLGTNDVQNLAFETSGSVRMLISGSNGNVGIGTTSPTQKLSIGASDSDAVIINSAGKLYFRDTTTYINEASGLSLVAGSTRAIIFSADGSERMRVAVGGNVGIGTTSPGYKLDVSGSFNFTTGGNYLTYNSGILYHGNYYQFPSGDNYLLYARTSGSLIFGSNDIERLRITSGGNVGIGTTSPTRALHISRTAAVAPIINLNTTDSTSNGYISWTNNSGVQNVAIGTNYGVSDTGAIEFISGSTTNMILRSSGNLGIGTTAPSVKLDVYGSTGVAARVTATSSGTAVLELSSAGATKYALKGGNGDSSFRIDQDGSDRVTIASGGNVGIGTTSPGYKLDITSVSAADGLRVRNTTSNIPTIALGVTDVANSDWNIQNRSGNLTFNGGSVGGNVGIGTTSPAYRLDVSGSINIAASNYYRIGGSAVAFVNGNEIIYGNQGGSQFVTISTGTTEKLRIQTNGNVGIGTTSPAYKLQVAGGDVAIDFNRYLRGGSGGDWNLINLYNGGTGDMEITMLSTSWYLRHNANASFAGSVGIGTTSPAAKLDVSGNVRATSFTGSFSGSLTGLASNATSASFAATASYSQNLTVGSTLVLDATLTDYASVGASSVGSNNLFSQNTSSYTSAFFKYTCASASNARSGEVVAVWNGATVQFTDFSTVDVGTTTAITSSVSIVTGQVQFNMQTNTSGWAIKSMATFI